MQQKCRQAAPAARRHSVLLRTDPKASPQRAIPVRQPTGSRAGKFRPSFAFPAAYLCIPQIPRARPYKPCHSSFVSRFLLIVLVLTFLICDTAGSFAGRLAGRLAFAAAALCHGIFQIFRGQRNNSLHLEKPPLLWFGRSSKRISAQSLFYYTASSGKNPVFLSGYFPSLLPQEAAWFRTNRPSADHLD